MGSILLKNVTVRDEVCDIFIAKGVICRIGKAGANAGWDIAGDVDVCDCTDKVAIPGFINMHTHAGMTLMRGIGEDMVLSGWLSKIWDIESRIDRDFVYWSVKVAAIEMIRTGTTTFNDQYWHFDAGHDAAVEMGIRPSCGYVILDRFDKEAAAKQKDECIENYEKYAERWKGHGAIYTLAAHAVYTVSEEMMIWAAEYARSKGERLHIHLSESQWEVNWCKEKYGLSPVEYLDRIGVLGPNVIAAHTLWLSEKDVEILGKRGVHCIHNINSNTKLASGYKFLYNELRDAGANVCIGTDGCASSNNLDILEAMKTTALFQKAWREDPKALPLEELMTMATTNGAKALGLNAGVIREGADADLSIINLNSPAFLSPGPILANLIYSAHSDCIESVIAGGRFVMRNREIAGEEEILQEARKAIKTIF